ncbi:HAD-IA family hydrolase [Halomonas halocynthiae]|uniref:HAD-IA family hydrolase n=1 Tax=Halomonas halocynthiae TaxID=176290 RepID=UPI0003F4B73E|nr:HAD-IA family hydrolase [Halomonas halocynthiae]
MRYRLLIFDWDGTLMDSLGRIVSCMQQAGRDVGLGTLAEDSVRDIIGLGLPEAIAKLCPGIDAQQADALRERYAYHFVHGDMPSALFYPGVGSLMQELASSQDVSLAVATGKSRRGLDRMFDETGSRGWFCASRTADETRSKPHPLMLEELLDELAVPVADAVMIGDTEYDMEMARALGMDRVAVSYGVHDMARLSASEPRLIADDFPELVDWLKG